MANRQRAYFFDSPFTTAGVKFNPNNIPKSSTFADLLDSVIFKTESGDLATTLQQGAVLLATTAVSKARSGAGVIIPEQLPVLTYGAGNTELITPGVQNYEGIKLTAVNGATRLDYQIDFDPNSLTAKIASTIGDYVVIVDVADANKPKKVLLSALTTPGYLTRTGTILTPTTAGDDLDMSGGDVTADTFLLKYAANTSVNPLSSAGNNGANLAIHGGAGQDVALAKTGGQLYLYGGAGVNAGVNGNTYLGWDGSTQIGTIGIGGAVQAGYEMAVRGNSYMYGDIYMKPNSPPGGGVSVLNSVIQGSDGILYSYSFKNTMTEIIGGTLPAGNAILLYDAGAAAYSNILVGATLDAFLHTNAITGALEMAVLDMTDRVTNTSVAAGAAIAWAKMAALTASRVPVLDGSGVMTASTITATQLSYCDFTSSGQTQLNSLNKSVTTKGDLSVATILTAASIRDVEFCDGTAGGFTVTMPLISTLTDGQTITLHQYAANTITLACNAGDVGFVSTIAATSATTTIGGAGKFVTIRADAATRQWVVVSLG